MIKNVGTKKLIYDLITFSNEVDEHGTNIRRTSYNKEHYRGYLELKQKLTKNILLAVVDLESKEKKETDIEWVTVEDYKKLEKTKKVCKEKFKDEEIKLEDKAIKALAYFYNERTEIPEVDEDSLNELESIIA